jgi:hypothetical protein
MALLDPGDEVGEERCPRRLRASGVGMLLGGEEFANSAKVMARGVFRHLWLCYASSEIVSRSTVGGGGVGPPPLTRRSEIGG